MPGVTLEASREPPRNLGCLRQSATQTANLRALQAGGPKRATRVQFSSFWSKSKIGIKGVGITLKILDSMPVPACLRCPFVTLSQGRGRGDAPKNETVDRADEVKVSCR